jgi:hypothetical protein
MSTKVLFSFDSEDYTTPEAADAEKWWAETMSKHGITACVCVVAELVRNLHETGRDDVLDAWKRHEIGYHTDFHSKPPTPAQYLDPRGWLDGIAEAMAREGKGIADVEALTGQHPSAFCKPGSSWGPQMCPAMARMDVPVFCDSPYVWENPAQPMWYAGQLLLDYHIHFDGYMDQEEGRLDRMKADFEARLAQHDGGYLIMYTHPCRLVTADFWDGVNFRQGNNPPRDQWKPAPLRPPEQTAAMQRDFDAFLGWVAAHPQVELTTYRQLYADYKEPSARSLSRESVVSLLQSSFGETDGAVLNAVTSEGMSHSPAEVLGVSVALAARSNGTALALAPLRRVLGPAEDAPIIAVPVEVGAEEFKAALREADEFIAVSGQIPSFVNVGRLQIGPGTLMRGLKEWIGNGPGTPPPQVRLTPGPELPAYAAAPSMERMKFENGWIVFPPDFKGENVIRHAKLQSWTAKPALR